MGNFLWNIQTTFGHALRHKKYIHLSCLPCVLQSLNWMHMGLPNPPSTTVDRLDFSEMTCSLFKLRFLSHDSHGDHEIGT
jgi:hypothetical protein